MKIAKRGQATIAMKTTDLPKQQSVAQRLNSPSRNNNEQPKPDSALGDVDEKSQFQFSDTSSKLIKVDKEGSRSIKQ